MIQVQPAEISEAAKQAVAKAVNKSAKDVSRKIELLSAGIEHACASARRLAADVPEEVINTAVTEGVAGFLAHLLVHAPGVNVRQLTAILMAVDDLKAAVDAHREYQAENPSD